MNLESSLKVFMEIFEQYVPSIDLQLCNTLPGDDASFPVAFLQMQIPSGLFQAYELEVGGDYKGLWKAALISPSLRKKKVECELQPLSDVLHFLSGNIDFSYIKTKHESYTVIIREVVS